VETIDEVLVNPDLKTLFSVSAGGASLSSATAGDPLTQIQADLVTLGYQPGNTNGVLDTMTKVAISQFQAEYGLAVTGEPSQSLANSLAAEVARRNGG
jgi:peptidoglycan hydrolase-like protein with peptidoglycan-binding domain